MKCLVCVLIINLLLTSFPVSVLSQSLRSGESGVKLCGRQFIRAIIYTCGGSRWKRLLDDQNDPFQISADKDYSKEMDSMRNLQRIFGSDGNQETEPSYADQVFDEYNNQYDQAPGDFSEYIRQIDGGSNKDHAFASTLVQHLPWARSIRKKREASTGMSSKCCTYGCTKKDISILC
ncbi:relaxin-3-like [Hemiscyllium ocellatum]|uniref:relaxin-3-like n=1 Tax=Hemiscyllium ocellatum TaxID=170820 RepID=UPI00296756B9|nr:relaxin-3-like [Hemiscyllium ocellatum]